MTENKTMNSLKEIGYKKLFICFVLYSIFGWLYEVFLEVVIYRWGFTNRGVLFGPYCPIYGVGAIVFIFAFYRFKKESQRNPIFKMIIIFVGCMLIATLLELITSYILEFTMGSWPWQTYTDYAINFQGRIALSPSVRFGIGGILFLYIFQPFFDKILSKPQNKSINVICIIVLFVLAVDVVYTMFIK